MAACRPKRDRGGSWRPAATGRLLLPLVLILTLALGGQFHWPAAAQEAGEARDMSAVAVVLENWPPHFGTTTEGRPTGLAIEMLEAVAKTAGVRISYRIVEDWDQAVRLFQRGEADLIPNLGRTPEREEWASFTRSLETMRISVIVRSSAHGFDARNPLSGRAVAVVRGNMAAALLEQRTDLVLMEFDALETALFALFAGQIDALVYPERIVLALAQKIGLNDRIRVIAPPLAEIKRAIAVRPDKPELLGRLDHAVDKFVGSPIYRDIFARWYQDQKPFWLDEQVLWGIVIALVLVVIIAVSWRYVSMLRMNRALVAAGAAREHAIEALRDSESRYRTLIERSNLAVQIANREGRRVFVNQAYAEMAGYDSLDELLNTPLGSFVAPHDRDRVMAYRKELFDRNSARKSYEFDAVRKDGTSFPVQAFVQRIKWQGEDAIQLTFIDLTERRRAEASLRESEARYRELIEGSNLAIMIGLRDGRRVLVNRAYAELLGYDSPEEVLSYPSGSLVVAEHDRERVQRYREQLFTGGDVPLSYEFDAVRKDGRIIPIQVFMQRIKWNGEDAVQRTFIDLTERRRAESELRESEVRFRHVFEGGGTGMFLRTMDGPIIQANKALADFLGVEPAALIGKSMLDFTVPEEIGEVRNRMNGIVSGEVDGYSVERRYVRKDGSIVWGIANMYTARDAAGNPAYVVATIRDITERKHAEEALAESEERFRSIFESGGAGIILCDMEGHYIEVNRAFCDLVGYQPEELLGQTPLVLTHPDDLKEAAQALEGIRNGRLTRHRREKRYLRRDGTVVWVIICVVPARSRSTGMQYWIGIIQDITERKLAEEALSESEGRYRDLIQGFPLGIQIFSADGRRLLANDAFARLSGHETVESAVSMPAGSFIRKEDRKKLRDLRARILRGDLQDVAVETTLVRRDGDCVPVLTFSRRIMWGGKRALQRTYIDLTEQKQAEAALRTSEERFRTVFESGGAGMILCDMNARYLRVNKAFCDLLGYSEEEVVGRTAFDFTHPEDLGQTRRGVQEVMQSSLEAPHIREKRYLRKDGQTVWVLLCLVVADDKTSGETYAIGIVQDISERKKAEQELADSQRRLLNAQRIARIGDWERDFTSDRIHWSDEVYRIFGIADSDFDVTYTSFVRTLVHPEDRELVETTVDQCLSDGDLYSLDHRIVRSDGEIRIVHEEGEVTLGPEGEPVRFSGTVQDVTELREARQALETSEARFRGVFEAGGAGIVLSDEKGTILDCNRPFTEFLGQSREELVGRSVTAILHPDDAPTALRQQAGLFRGDVDHFHAERRMLRRDGSVIWVNVSATMMRDAPGAPPTLIGIIQDITKRKESESALAHKSRFLDLVRELTMAANQAPHFADAVKYCLDRICAFAGWPLGHAFIRSETDPDVLLPMMVWHLDDPDQFRPYCEATRTMKLRVGVGVPGLAIETGDVVWRSDIPVDPTRPTARTDAATEVGLRSGFAAPVMVGKRVVAVFEFYATESIPRDEDLVEVIRQAGTELGRVFEREEAETAMLRREEQLRQIIDNVPHLIYVKDRNGRYLLANKALAQVYNLSIDQVIGQYQMDLYPDRDEAVRILAHDRGVIAAGQMVTSSDGHFHMADGSVRNMRVTKMPYTTQYGEVAVLGIAEDITEMLQHEEERRRAQRMDALGKMTGGVAHDFNNLLTIILGNLQLLDRRLTDDSLRTFASTAERAARRGADVTRRLLAFARSQPLEPRPIDLNHLVRDMTALVARLLGSGIEIETRLAPDLWQSRADPGQVEDALLNLVINARDAMPDGGRLVIETRNITIRNQRRTGGEIAPGSYATVAVSDTGVGMSQEVIARAVEPFFTTKEVGKGSGLGLSMVYGFVRQSGGDVEIESEPGKGSTLRIYLPRVDAVDDAPVNTGEVSAPSGGRETVLLVEDNPDVREFARYVLSGFDYDVLDAKDSEAALAVLDEVGKVDLLFTDVVLPGGVSGPMLAKKVRERIPGIVVIFTSGNWDATPDSLEAAAFLQKPYSGKDLAALVRSTLDSRHRQGA